MGGELSNLFPSALPDVIVINVAREMGSWVRVDVVAIEGVKQGVSRGDIVVFKVSTGIRLGQGRGFWCQTGGIRGGRGPPCRY